MVGSFLRAVPSDCFHGRGATLNESLMSFTLLPCKSRKPQRSVLLQTHILVRMAFGVPSVHLPTKCPPWYELSTQLQSSRHHSRAKSEPSASAALAVGRARSCGSSSSAWTPTARGSSPRFGSGGGGGGEGSGAGQTNQ